jgi:hypothetical protein
MTREKQVAFCKKCVNRKPDMYQGVLCGMTGEKANFDLSCEHFQQDPAYKEPQLLEAARINGIRVTDDMLERLRLEQNFPMAIITGGLIGFVGALIWALVTVTTQFQIGYMAVAIGAGVGFTMRYFGKGIDQEFGIAGATIALLSCLLGNFFCIVGFTAEQAGVGVVEVLGWIDFALIPEIIMETFEPMDLLFYAIAVYEGYRFSFRTTTE